MGFFDWLFESAAKSQKFLAEELIKRGESNEKIEKYLETSNEYLKMKEDEKKAQREEEEIVKLADKEIENINLSSKEKLKSAVEKGDFKKQISYYEETIKSESQNSTLYKELGSLYENIENFDKAIEYYEKAISLGDMNSHLKLASLYSKLEKKETNVCKALVYISKSVEHYKIILENAKNKKL